VFAVRPAGSTQLVPWPISFEHFDTVWNDIGFGVFFYNSVVMGLGVLVFVTVLSVMGGYALARFKFRGQRVFLLAMLCSQFIP
ncbi:carbohydrate ABC transporter permease, partial [Saccharothrix sp. MB29]|nr:carbohydrate ABC transporter permease [Saccharothrix sp. MB29]